MTSETYRTKAGTVQHRPLFDSTDPLELEGGFCLACGSEADSVEPDARRRPCEACGAAKVYGLEELVLMNIARFAGDDTPRS